MAIPSRALTSQELAMPSLRDFVRQETRTAHDALEATALMLAFSSGAFSAAQYRCYLCLQLGLHAPLEAALSDWWPSNDTADEPLRLCKSAWLRADLVALGEMAHPAPLPLLPALPTIGSRAQAMGVMYVLEGGTLGLQVVRKRLQDAHPALQGADRFLRGYGADTGLRWRGFVAALDALPATQWPVATAAACATFAAFQSAFSAPASAAPA